jgi:hypothetical protein
MEEWGWRVPFLLGALIAPVGLFIRQRVDETPAYQQLQKVDAAPAAKTDFQMARTMVLAFAFPVLQSVLTYLFLSYFPTFGQRYVGLSPSAALWSTVLATLVMGVTCHVGRVVRCRWSPSLPSRSLRAQSVSGLSLHQLDDRGSGRHGRIASRRLRGDQRPLSWSAGLGPCRDVSDGEAHDGPDHSLQPSVHAVRRLRSLHRFMAHRRDGPADLYNMSR